MPRLAEHVADRETLCSQCDKPIPEESPFVWGLQKGQRFHPTCTTMIDHYADPSPLSIEDVLGEGGILIKALNLAPRPGQLQMANAIRRALREKQHIIAEAGTGVGKSLAYLVPLILEGRRAIISTHVKNLQRQIARDIPRIQLPMAQAGIPGAREITFTILKGRTNYLCLHALETVKECIESEAEALKPGEERRLFDEQTYRDIEYVDTWNNAGANDSGDMDDVPVTGLTRAALTVTSDECLGKRCPFIDACWAERALATAQTSSFVITNHALYMTDLVVRLRTNGMASILPDHRTGIIDEAHHLEDVACSTFGDEVTVTAWRRGRRHIERILNGPNEKELAAIRDEQAEERVRAGFNPMEYEREDEGDADDFKAPETTKEAWLSFLERVEKAILAFMQPIDRRIAQNPDNINGQGTVALLDTDRVDQAIVREMLTMCKEMDPKTSRADWVAPIYREKWEKQGRWLEEFARKLRAVSGTSDHEVVRFATKDSNRMRVEALPIDVSGILAQNLFGSFATVTATSATLAFGANPKKAFDHWRERVGLSTGDALMAPSPFPYEQNCLIYAPANQGRFKPPRAGAANDEKAAYYDRLAAEAAKLINIAGGGAFFLFTSNEAMRSIAERFRRDRHAWAEHMVVQGENGISREAMTAAFLDHGDGVLLGVASFWEGVDIPGRRLRMVMIDRIPFPVPNDPVHAARERAFKAKYPNRDPFGAISLPHAATRMKQGAGRLIRAVEDWGVIVVWDGRFLTSGYSSVIQAALPPALLTTDIEEVKAFYQTRLALVPA